METMPSNPIIQNPTDEYFERSAFVSFHDPYDNHEEGTDPRQLDPFYQGSEVDDEIYPDEKNVD